LKSCYYGTAVIQVRMILVLGYWVLSNIHWAVLVLGDICCCSDTQSNQSDQTAVSTIHKLVNDYLVQLVTCTLTAAIILSEHRADMVVFC